jgi:hypothetical protein
MNATIGNGYVKYMDGIRKFYRAVLDMSHIRSRIRVSRRRFVRASEAQEYKVRVLVRLASLRMQG